MKKNVEDIIERHLSCQEQLLHASNAKEIETISKESARLAPLVETGNALLKAYQEYADTHSLLQDPDCDISALAHEEVKNYKKYIADLEHQMKVLLIPKDEADDRNIILEIRAGTGGDEAALFAATLLTMYEKYTALKKWKFSILHSHETNIGGYKEVSINISGTSIFKTLKYESGVHRVQRVPETETNGRVHTSTVTVAVLPEAEEIDVHIEDKDLRIDTYRSQGAGGQHVNTTDSAVRVTHFPSGIVTQCQDEKSQHKNRAQAMKMLRAKLYEYERNKIVSARSEDRKNQIGSGDRSERIRTYNFPQGRVSDHRIQLTLYKLEQILQGEVLDEIIDALILADQKAQLSSLVHHEN